MKILTADYIISSPSLKECPNFQGCPEIVLVGRSNVGKSSFINSLTQRKNLARTSNTPGKTRYINFYDVNYAKTKSSKDKVMMVDLPGYGFAKISKSEQEKWRKNLEAYLSKRDSIRLVIQLIDSRHGPQDNDIQMYEWLQYNGRRVQVVLTKTDKLSKNEIAKQIAVSARALDLSASDLLAFSAETNAGRDQAWGAILEALSLPQLPLIGAAAEDSEELAEHPVD